MKEIALKYHLLGLSVIPVGANKIPVGRWRKSIEAPVEPNGQFDGQDGIGIVCGAASQGVEVIDVDLKYDISGTLWERFTNLLGDLFKRLVVEKTPSGGYHLIYRCEVLQGNQKLASRFTTAEERKKEPNLKTKILIETRGTGGYFMCAPSAGYSLIQNGFDSIPVLSVDERDFIINCAKSLNDVIPVSRPSSKAYYSENNPFEDFNRRGDIGEILQRHGWDYVSEDTERLFYKRPGSANRHSATVHKGLNMFYPFTSSTEFAPNQGYSASMVLCTLEHNGDYSSCANWLKNHGYGQVKTITHDKPKGEFLLKKNKYMDYLQKARKGTLPMGLPLSVERLDEHWRAKTKHLVCLLGLHGTGKSQMMWYIMVLIAKIHGWRFVIYSGENSGGNVFRKLIEFYNDVPIRLMSEEMLNKSVSWVEKHFTIIDKKALYTYRDILSIAKEQIDEFRTNRLKEDEEYGLLIDPYNSLFKNKKYNENDHSYDYDALGDMRQWIEDNSCSIYLVVHAVTEASRKVHAKGHPFEGMPIPPIEADAEGGQKFSSRCDDFITHHRYPASKLFKTWCEWHIRKIKETETGGCVTFFNEPVKFKMNAGQSGFEDEFGYNPSLRIKTSEMPDNYYEPSF